MRKLLKISLVCAVGVFVIAANPKTAFAYEEGVAGFIYDKDTSVADDKSNSTTLISMSDSELPIPGYNNLAVADVDTNLMIRSGAGENYKLIGKLPKNGGCEVLGNKDGWTKISARTSGGKIEGYVKSDFLLTGDEALRKAKEVGSYVATAIANGLNIRDTASTDAKVIDQMAKGEELIVLDSKVSTEDNEHSDWVKVAIDSDDADNDTAYVAKEYVKITFELVRAVNVQEVKVANGVSSVRGTLINLAKDHLGEAYVWGGTRLGRGVDCSGFTQALYRKMGYSIPRTSRSQAASGHRISASELKPGDLVFYGSSSYINHVAMYIGNGRIIHASNKRDGIKISYMYYRSPVKYVRYIK